jgi:tetratricopeptide (TPR) repeat protein
LGILYKSKGKLADAEKMFVQVLEGFEKVLGVEHTSTLDTVSNLGSLYVAQSRLADAEKMYRRALKGFETVLGVEHPSTLNTVNNLGILYADQGKLAEAEEKYRRALKGFEKAFEIVDETDFGRSFFEVEGRAWPPRANLFSGRLA